MRIASRLFRLLVFILSFSIFLIVTSCDVPVEPLFKYDYSVLSVLSVDSSVQRVGIYPILPWGEKVSSEGSAVVTINGKRLVRISELYREGWIYKYALYEPGFVKPGEIYELRIEVKGLVITGTTKVPGIFRITSHPRESTIYLSDTTYIRLRWEKSLDAYGYIVRLISPPIEVSPGIFVRWKIFITYTDSNEAIIEPGKFNILNRYIPGRYVINVTAIDKNLSLYYEGNMSSGLNGALGVFGSTVSDSVIVYVQWR